MDAENHTVMVPRPPDELSAEEKAKVTADMLLYTKRVSSVLKRLPQDTSGPAVDNETMLELSRMNRQQRRAAISEMKKKQKSRRAR